MINQAFQGAVRERQARFEQKLALYHESERTLLTALAQNEPVPAVKGKHFLKKVPELAPSTVYTLVKKLDHQADLERSSKGYQLANPLLAEYLRQYG